MDIDQIGAICFAFSVVAIAAGLIKKFGAWRQKARPGPAASGGGAELLPSLLSVHQAFEGVLGIGGTGSGKTTILAWLMQALMARGVGMLILTAKADDFDFIRRLARQSGRLGDLVRFAPDEPWRLDFL
jgi:primosomal protein N'